MAAFLLLLSLTFIVGWVGFLLWLFIKTDKGAKEPAGAMWAAFGFGVLSVGIAIGLELLLPDLSKSLNITGTTMFLYTMPIGIIEEAAKFLPLAFFIYKKPYFNEHTDGILYFGIAGLTFGVLEDFLYLHSIFTAHNSASSIVGVVRVSILFLFHVAGTAIIGYYLARSKIQRRSLWQPAIAFSIIAFLHGFYDFLLSFTVHTAVRGSDEDGVVLMLLTLLALIISLLLGVCFFLYYRRAKQWDASVGLAYDPKLQTQAVPQTAQSIPQPPVTATTPTSVATAPVPAPTAVPQPSTVTVPSQPPTAPLPPQKH